MCTAINFNGYFGRNLDLEYSYNEQVVITPKNYKFNFFDKNISDKFYSIVGIATICENYPLYYDACNEYGLAGAGLSFPYDDLYSNNISTSKIKIAPYEILTLVLRTCKNINEVKLLLKNSVFINKHFNEKLKSTNMHYMFADNEASIVVESKYGEICIYDNKVNILTNAPTFLEQLENLKKFKNLTNEETNKTINSKGSGALGLPGDYTSKSRFVRGDFLLKNCCKDNNDLSEFFIILSSVSVPNCAVKVTDEKYFYTRYSSCIDLKEKIYYYKVYENSRINAVRLTNLEGFKLISFNLNKYQDIHFQN